MHVEDTRVLVFWSFKLTVFLYLLSFLFVSCVYYVFVVFIIFWFVCCVCNWFMYLLCFSLGCCVHLPSEIEHEGGIGVSE